jgi:hypothetical protein
MALGLASLQSLLIATLTVIFSSMRLKIKLKNSPTVNKHKFCHTKNQKLNFKGHYEQEKNSNLGMLWMR